MINNPDLERVYRYPLLRPLQRSRVEAVSQEAAEQFCMDLSWQEEEARQQGKETENGRVPAKAFFLH